MHGNKWSGGRQFSWVFCLLVLSASGALTASVLQVLTFVAMALQVRDRASLGGGEHPHLLSSRLKTVSPFGAKAVMLTACYGLSRSPQIYMLES